MQRWNLVAGLAVLLAGCATTYVTPGGPARLEQINRIDVAECGSACSAGSPPTNLAQLADP